LIILTEIVMVGILVCYIISSLLYYLFYAPCVELNCQNWLWIAYLPVNRYLEMLKQLGVDPRTSDFYAIFIFLFSNYIMILSLTLSSRGLYLTWREFIHLSNKLTKQGILISCVLLFMFIIAVDGPSINFTNRLDIRSLSLQLPMIYSMSILFVGSLMISSVSAMLLFFVGLALVKRRLERASGTLKGGRR